jgi:hypothetical protein
MLALAHRTENFPCDALAVILFTGLKPAFEFVLLVADERVDDHG